MLVPALGERFARWMLPIASAANAAAARFDGRSLASATALGALLGLVWSPCSGPLLGSALTLVASEGGVVRGGVVLALFGLGAAVPLVGVAYASRRGFARIDHAAGAMKVGKALRPTELLVFGNPQGGTPLMECEQTAGIDLPLKALVWQDERAQVWLGYNDPAFLAQRHGVPACPAVENLRKALAALVETVVAR
jgi:hypothetical protein